METQFRFLAFLLILVLALSTPALAEEDESVKIIDAWPGYGIYILTDDGEVINSNGFHENNSIVATDVVSVVKDGGTYPMLLHSDGSITIYYDSRYKTPFEFDSEGWDDVVLMGASSTHAVGLKRDGTWISAGEYRNGECDVEEWTDIVQLQVGYHYTVGLKADGTVVATGVNLYGRCNVSQWTDIVKIAVSPENDYDSATLGLKSDGTVVAAGNKNSDQTYVGRWKNVIDICAGEADSFGLTNDGKILSTDDNFYRYVPKDYQFENAVGIMGCKALTPILIKKADNTFEAIGSDVDIYNEHLSDVGSLLEDVGKTLSESQETDSTEGLTSSECEQLAVDYLKKMLKNPESLQVHSTSSIMSGDSYIVTIDYSAMNGFGGYNRETFICMVDANGEVSAASSY